VELVSDSCSSSQSSTENGVNAYITHQAIINPKVGNCSLVSNCSQKDRSNPAEIEQKEARGRKQVMTPRLSTAFDAARISDRQATHILMAAAEGFGVDAKDYVINRTSIKGYREKLREIKAKEIKDNFGGHELNAAVIHWDGKLLQAVTGKEMVDRLPIIITNGDSEQILAVPFLESGTGAFTAGAVYETLCEWGLRDIVKACCFDTMAVNTGKDNGCCILLEKKQNVIC